MESALRPSNHLIAIGPRLDRNTLYIGFVLRMDNHFMTEMAHMLYWVRSPIVDGECWLMEMPRKSCPFNPMREGQLGNLVQGFAHCIISQPSVS